VYGFPHLLPGIAVGSEAMEEALADVTKPTSLFDPAILFVALTAPTAFDELERMMALQPGVCVLP
jgi:hypothetical protein